MLRVSFRSVVGVMIASLPCFLLAKNSLVDDFAGGDNQNDLGYYWSYYDDNMLQYPDDRPQIAPNSRPSTINVPYTVRERHLFGNASDTSKVKDYTFFTGLSGDDEFGTMPFTFGEPWEANYCSKGKKCAMPYVGITTMLAREGSWVDLTGATAVTFKIRSHVNDLNEVRFMVHTYDIDRYSNKPGSEGVGDECGYYGSTITVLPGDWQTFTIPLNDLALPGTWAHEFEFDITKCTKLSWEIKGDGRLTTDTLDIDDIWILGDGMVQNPSNNDPWCQPSQAHPSGGMVADFEAAPHEKPPFGAPWYAFTDGGCSGNTQIAEGASYNSRTRMYQLKWIEKTGSGLSGYAPFIHAEFGKNVRQYPLTGDTLLVKGFAGIACNVYDSSSATYLDLSRGKFGEVVAPGPSGSIRFDYLTNGDNACKLTVELLDVNDVPDRISPNRHESRGTGNVWHHDLCGSPSWRSVEIPFDSLHLWSDCAWCIPVPFDKTKVASIRFKVQGPEGAIALLAIDNVYFPTNLTTGVAGSRQVLSAGSTAMSASCRNGIILINMPAGADYSNRVVSVLDPRGRVVATRRITGGSGAVINMAGNVFADGLYFIRLEGGRQTTSQNASQAVVPITIVH